MLLVSFLRTVHILFHWIFFVCNTFFVAAGGISTQNVNAKTNRMYVPIDFMNEKFSFTPHWISWIEMDCNCMPSNNNCCLEKWRSSGCFVCLCVFGFFFDLRLINAFLFKQTPFQMILLHDIPKVICAVHIDWLRRCSTDLRFYLAAFFSCSFVFLWSIFIPLYFGYFNLISIRSAATWYTIHGTHIVCTTHTHAHISQAN